MESVNLIIPIFDASHPNCYHSIWSAANQVYGCSVTVIARKGAIFDFEMPKNVEIHQIEQSGISTVIDMVNFGVHQSQCDYLSLVAPSTILNPYKIYCQMQKRDDAVAFSTNGITMKMRLGKIIRTTGMYNSEVKHIDADFATQTLKKNIATLENHYPISSGLVYKHSFFEENGYFNISFPLLFEIEMWLRILKWQHLQYVSELLYTDIHNEMSYDSYFKQDIYISQLNQERIQLLK